MRKIVISLFLVCLLFLIGMLMFQNEQKQKIANNPYQKENLHQETINDLEDPVYQNIIIPSELNKALKEKKNMTVYFYSPTCPACREASPIIQEVAKKLGEEVVLMNLLEFENGWDDYNIEYTPTLIKYENGVEASRLVTLHDASEYENWFKEWE